MAAFTLVEPTLVVHTYSLIGIQRHSIKFQMIQIQIGDIFSVSHLDKYFQFVSQSSYIFNIIHSAYANTYKWTVSFWKFISTGQSDYIEFLSIFWSVDVQWLLIDANAMIHIYNTKLLTFLGGSNRISNFKPQNLISVVNTSKQNQNRNSMINTVESTECLSLILYMANTTAIKQCLSKIQRK